MGCLAQVSPVSWAPGSPSGLCQFDLTVLAINASTHPEQSVRVRALLSDLLEAIQDCEGDMGTCAELSDEVSCDLNMVKLR